MSLAECECLHCVVVSLANSAEFRIIKETHMSMLSQILNKQGKTYPECG